MHVLSMIYFCRRIKCAAVAGFLFLRIETRPDIFHPGCSRLPRWPAAERIELFNHYLELKKMPVKFFCTVGMLAYVAKGATSFGSTI